MEQKIRQTVAKQSLSGDIKELLEEITIFEQQLVNDIETLSNQLGIYCLFKNEQNFMML
jgi:hypothetical protein